MTAFICALCLLAVSLCFIVTRKTYHYLPPKELKRRAAQGDPQAVVFYRAVAFGENLELLLWTIIVLTSAVGFVLLARVAPILLSLIAVVALLWIFYEVLPGARITAFGSRITVWLTPPIVWCLQTSHPILRRLSSFKKRYAQPPHTGLYERADLLEVIELQLKQSDSRISNEELMIAAQALSFSDHTVHDLLTPWKSVKRLESSDIIGPIVIDEVHRSEQPVIPVVEKSAAKAQIVGTLRATALGLKSQGKVADLMDQAVYYLHEDDSLAEALHAFYVTNQPMFIVLDSHGDYIGSITLAALLRQLLGELPGAQAEAYNEYAEIAARHTEATAKQETSEVRENIPSSEETVVE